MSTSHCRLWYHVILVTKERAAWLDENVRSELILYLGGIARKNQATLSAGGGWVDHLHLLVQCPAKLALADLVRALKANSSRWVHERFASHAEFAWSAGYSAFTVSHSPVPAVKRYIATQGQHHASHGFLEEYKRFLEAHSLESDFSESVEE